MLGINSTTKVTPTDTRIDVNIPVPSARGTGMTTNAMTIKIREDLGSLVLGESVFYQATSEQNIKALRGTLSNAWGPMKRGGKVFTTRKWTEKGVDGVRVWRVR